MAYKIRVILDVEEDVFRDLIVDESIDLEKLHFTIAKSFGFKGQEMASFYKTNDNWEQGVEIPLFDMSEDGGTTTMQNYLAKEVLKKEGDKLIYVYDFFSMWSFFVELSEIIDKTEDDLPKISLSFGNVPDQAPEKEFKAEKDDFGTQDNLNDENGFENIDDFDFDNY